MKCYVELEPTLGLQQGQASGCHTYRANIIYVIKRLKDQAVARDVVHYIFYYI